MKLFGNTISLGAIISLCRALRHGLAAGLDFPRVMEMQASKGALELRAICSDLAVQLRSGESFKDALQPYKDRFPPLFSELAVVGEETGNLPEMFGELEKYFTLRQTQGREFRSMIFMPVFQLFMAIFVISALIFILGFIASTSGGKPIAVLGLTGTGGAVTFLVLSLGSLFTIYFFFKATQKSYGFRGKVEAFLLRVPKLGACIRSFVMQRFCTALYLTTGSGMSVIKAMDLSLRASGNAVFINAFPGIRYSIKAGYDLQESLTMSRIFEPRFLEVLEVGETSGRLSESMKQQAAQYAEEGEFQLKALTKMGGFAVWALVAIIMIFMIMNLAGIYLGALNSVGG
ncbi:type II secretion system F family protein [Telmatocola sphagniphila]|uniref:Type II secretion system F family protein n=1 Tax=Telmatocola sphagniphila TaxID=1123043 RepID=A0A8E6EV51_9BACT|nr:type II secretion system F family protein [Telmatocola sphagniphila]QVL34504.1 type II secretion system F family protein [Telmatocola sphagniphila]